ncbi:hypothetical protein BP5796_03050 [Coleophoma crateriformis]|uniref:DUF6594 domain-containing protein n=1 Tax=Coleophoma crateriformis TaxID=565419 RepID=A0A3D8SM54_9HELO|nr:hypothetical protein BP5796_03050 [Coleophoma crateriformis]
MAEITSIEKELDLLDVSDSKNEEMHWRLRKNEWYEGWDSGQRELLKKLREKLSLYGISPVFSVSIVLEEDIYDFLIKYTQLRGLDSAPSRDFRHVFRWIYDRKPLDIGVYDFILHRDDFVSTRQGTCAPFDGLIESVLSWWPSAPFQVSKTGDPLNGMLENKWPQSADT